MALVYNTTNETITTTVYGNHFEWKPKQIKNLQDRFAEFIKMERGYLGLQALPESFEDAEYKSSAEGKAQLESIEQAGIEQRVNFLRGIIYNNQVSLRGDLEKSNIKSSPEIHASKGELDAMRLVAQYQKKDDDAAQKRVDEIKELMKKVGPVTK
jgi:hypothetical protein